MAIEADYLWMDGDLVPFADAKVHVLAHTLHYGLGVFEGIRAYTQPDGRAGVWHLDLHLRRMLESMSMTRMVAPYGLTELHDACLATLRANRHTEAYIRPLAFYGAGAMGLGARTNQVHVIVASWPWGAYLGEDGLKRGISVQTSSFVRNHPNATLQRAKVVGHYVNSIIARYEANENGFDEALMLDHQGYVAEGTGENVFLVRDHRVLTPPLANVLPGITRTSVMEILRHEGLEVEEQFFGRDAIYSADEVFMTGTAAEVTPVRELDRRRVGTGAPGPVTQLVQRLYLEGVRGRVPWLERHITRAT